MRASLQTSLAILTALIGIGAKASPVYRPFEFSDPSLANRQDIREVLPGLQVRLDGKQIPPLTALQLDDARLVMFDEIAALLEGLASGTAPATAELPAPPVSCESHRAFEAIRFPQVKTTDAACRAIPASVVPLFDGHQKACRYVEQPERFVEEQTPGDVSAEQVSSLEGLIRVSGEALSHVSFPQTLDNPAFRSRMRVIIAKIRHDKLMKSIDKHLGNYHKVLGYLQNQPGCFLASPYVIEKLKGQLHEMGAELVAAKAYLTELDRSGRARAEADRKAVLARGRERARLPYPSLTDQERQLLSLYVGGVYWRMRGGGLLEKPEGTQLTRFYFTFLAMSVLGYVNGGDDGRQAGQGLYFRVFKGWGRYMDMGRSPNENDRYHDLTHMTKRGLYQIGDASTVLANKGYDRTDLTIGGLHMGPCYYYSWERLSKLLVGNDLKPPYGALVDGATSWGELCTGASISLGLSKSLLKGQPPRSPFPDFNN